MLDRQSALQIHSTNLKHFIRIEKINLQQSRRSSLAFIGRNKGSVITNQAPKLRIKSHNKETAGAFKPKKCAKNVHPQLEKKLTLYERLFRMKRNEWDLQDQCWEKQMSWFIWTVESEGTQIEPDKLTLYLRWLLKKVGVECKERKIAACVWDGGKTFWRWIIDYTGEFLTCLEFQFVRETSDRTSVQVIFICNV